MKKLVLAAICAILIIVPCCFHSSAAGTDAEIRIENVTGIVGDTVFVPVKISNNPGISAVAFSLNFDKSALTYKGFYEGALSDYTVYDHSKKGKISFACIEKKDNKNNGLLVCFEFSIKKGAKEKTYDITFGKTYFSNDKGKKVKVGANGGSLKVSDMCDGGHSFGDWSAVIPESCTNDGIKVRSCQTCGHTESAAIPATGHTIQETFTVDIVAEGSKPGMLSRHCNTCGTKTNVIIYTQANTTPLGINSIAEKLGDDAIGNLVYFLNGERTYPEITGDDFDIEEFTASDRTIKNDDGTINVDVAADRLLRRLFGDDKKSGLWGAVKRAAMADEIPLKLVGKLIRVIFI